jgi:hypothetical protein
MVICQYAEKDVDYALKSPFLCMGGTSPHVLVSLHEVRSLG